MGHSSDDSTLLSGELSSDDQRAEPAKGQPHAGPPQSGALRSDSGSSKSQPTEHDARSELPSGPRRSDREHFMEGVSILPVFAETERFVERNFIARGGMGTVVKAFDKELEREVAIKVLDPELSSIATEIQRFTEEARITGQLEHPYIVPVYECGSDAYGSRFLCMRLVHGETLENLLEKAGDALLDTERLADHLQVFAKVCDAVAFAHSRGVIHRDLKPSNVMVSDFGQVYVVDWGVARFSKSLRPDSDVNPRPEANLDPPGLLIGTPSYMSPEQHWGLHDKLDERTDVFGLGAVLYHVLTGSPPVTADHVVSIRVGTHQMDIPPPQSRTKKGVVPPELSRIALKAMAYEPSQRYPSVEALKSDIERFQRGAWYLPRKTFAAGSVIMRQGDAGQEAHIIVEGRCAAFLSERGQEVILREMGPGDVFGETAVISNRPRTASVKALTDVEVMVVSADIFETALGLNSWMGVFVKALAERFRDVDERLRQLEGKLREAEDSTR